MCPLRHILRLSVRPCRCVHVFIYPLFLGRSAVICIRIALQYLTIDPCQRPVRDYLRDLLRFRPGSWLDLIKPYGREGTSECTRVECTEEQQDKY